MAGGQPGTVRTGAAGETLQSRWGGSRGCDNARQRAGAEDEAPSTSEVARPSVGAETPKTESPSAQPKMVSYQPGAQEQPTPDHLPPCTGAWAAWGAR